MKRFRKSRWLRLILIGFPACILITIILALVACQPENRLRLFYGWHTIDVIQQADQVTLYHIQGQYEWQKHIIGTPVKASPDFGRRIKALVANPKSYIADPYMCLPNPNVLVQFHRGTETVNAYFCFDCHESTMGEDNNYMAFDPVWNQMVSLVQEAFPDDASIQSLKIEENRFQ